MDFVRPIYENVRMIDVTLKELYNLHLEPSPLYGLQIWYNDLITKDISEINEVDVGKMSRQNVLEDVAIQKGLEFLTRDHLSGGIYDGETMESMLQLADRIKENPGYQKELLRILEEISAAEIDEWEWGSEESKNEYLFWIKELRRKLEAG